MLLHDKACNDGPKPVRNAEAKDFLAGRLDIGQASAGSFQYSTTSGDDRE